jgi:hypothetical protein
MIFIKWPFMNWRIQPVFHIALKRVVTSGTLKEATTVPKKIHSAKNVPAG